MRAVHTSPGSTTWASADARGRAATLVMRAARFHTRPLRVQPGETGTAERTERAQPGPREVLFMGWAAPTGRSATPAVQAKKSSAACRSDANTMRAVFSLKPIAA